MSSVKVQFSLDELDKIRTVIEQIKIEGDRYPEEQERLTGL